MLSRKAQNRAHFTLMVLWIIVGLPVSWWLRQSIPWLVFLSVYAIVAAHSAGLHHTEDSHD